MKKPANDVSHTANPDALAKKFRDEDGHEFEKFDQLERETSQGPVVFIKDEDDNRRMILWRGEDHEHGEGFTDITGKRYTPIS